MFSGLPGFFFFYRVCFHVSDSKYTTINNQKSSFLTLKASGGLSYINILHSRGGVDKQAVTFLFLWILNFLFYQAGAFM